MNCLNCGSKNTVRTFDNIADAKRMEEMLQIHIPVGEIWVCEDCKAGWGYDDGELYLAGLATDNIANAKIPKGCLAVFGEVGV